MTLPINYADGQTIHGSDVDSWTVVINALAALVVPSTASLIAGYTSTATSSTAITLTYTSTGVQALTGTVAQTINLPTTSVTAGIAWLVVNNSSASATVKASGGATVSTVAANAVGVFVAASNTPTTATAWNTVFTLSLTNPTISGYTETVQALGTTGSTKTIGALTNGTIVTATLTNATATAFTLPTPVAGLSFLLSVQQPGTTGSGTYSFTSPSGSVVWSSAGTPSMTQGANKRDVLSFVCIDGANWHGAATQGYTA